MLSDGISMFVSDDVLTAKVCSIIGEVKQMHFDCRHTVLFLGTPSLCAAVTNLFWQQEVSVLEKVKLADLNVD
ncbi:hypothetical protein L208DRAFT_1261692 [Tricholoma matsutake]|nr:hypothetical protein L208DRAFT_1261692 [Tricholoma matsutake 945]